MTRSVLVSFIIALAMAAGMYSGQLGEDPEAGATNTSVLDTRAARQSLPVLVQIERVVAVERRAEWGVQGSGEDRRMRAAAHRRPTGDLPARWLDCYLE